MNSFLNYYFNQLKSNFLNPELELRVLLNKNSKNNKEIFLSNFNLEDINISSFKKSFDRRINREPISKITNLKSFWKYDFYVNKDVLDPRPETELIIEQVLKFFPKLNESISILDMGTGTGCLAISLSKEYPNSKVLATDISFKALKVAKQNAQNLKCNNNIEFVRCDLINKIENFDIIVSNPPYLSEFDYKKTSQEIRKYEPKVALIASAEGFEYYYKIANFLAKILNKKSKAFLEIGSSQAKKIINIFNINNVKCVKIAKDIQNLDRVIILNKS